MLCIPKIGHYLKVLADDEGKDFVAISFREYFKSTRKKNILKWRKKILERCWISLCLTIPDEVKKYVDIMQSNSSDKYVHHYNIEILNLFDPELQQINTKPIIKNKIK